MGRIRIVVADKTELFREGLAKILEDTPNMEVVSKCSSALESIEKARELKPDIIISDTEASEDDCIEATRRAGQLEPETRIIIPTNSREERALFSALKVGARAYLSKDVTAEDLIGTITRVHAGEVIISPPMAVKLIEKFALLDTREEAALSEHGTNLSKRETDVLQLVAKGSTNKEIAAALLITENTVKVHLSKILEKLHVRNRQQAAAMALEKGIVYSLARSDT